MGGITRCLNVGLKIRNIYLRIARKMRMNELQGYIGLQHDSNVYPG